MNSNKSLFRILSLDGGGAKGFYTLGVLKEIEAVCGSELSQHFQLVYGTSTGAIIAALIALGKRVDEIHTLYKEHVPTVMRARCAHTRSGALNTLAKAVFGERTFSEFNTSIGIVATQWDFEKPMIFKTNIQQAHGRQGTFVPGFGCKISEAIEASCSAYPFFERPRLKTSKGDIIELMDGGYCANNPCLYAIADATVALKHAHDDLRVISIGVGSYPEPSCWGFDWLVRRLRSVRLLQKTLNVNTQSMEQLRQVLYKDVPTVRVSDTFVKPEMATDLMEHDMVKLDMLYRAGRESFATHEQRIRDFMEKPEVPQ